MSDEVIDLAELAKLRRPAVRRYEMSKATFRQLEFQMKDHLVELKPEEQRSTSPWGIPINFNNEIPFGEIKPVYA